MPGVRMTPEEVKDILRWLWQVNRTSILYIAWLIQTWFMLGMIIR